MKKLCVFDLDGTLAESKSALDPGMAALLGQLLQLCQVAIISGGAWTQFQKQILPNLPDDDRLNGLSLLPTCGTKFFRRQDGQWQVLYSEDFTPEEAKTIIAALDKAFDQSGLKPR
jgi:hydroxymethylpyrimidine pyrophosphatase-like HAD family hydrolase